jgi:hypothetical protein
MLTALHYENRDPESLANQTNALQAVDSLLQLDRVVEFV